MADVFSLVLQVEGAEELVKLQGLIKGVGTAGAGAEKSLEQAAKQTKAIQRGFANLAAEFKSSFGELSNAVKALSNELGNLRTQATKKQPGKSTVEELGDDAEESIKSVRAMRAELQKLYEAQIQGSGTLLGQKGYEDPEKAFEALRRAKQFGVSLSPQDNVLLASGKDQLKALEDEAKRAKKFLEAQVNAIESEKDFNRRRAAERAAEERRTKEFVAKQIAEGQALQQAVTDREKAYQKALEDSRANERGFNARRAREREQEQQAERDRVAKQITANKAELAARMQVAKDWQASEDALAVARRKVLDADIRFNAPGKNEQTTALKQLRLVEGVRQYIAAARPIEEIRQKFGDAALAIAQNEQAYRTLELAATTSQAAASKGAKQAAAALQAERDEAIATAQAWEKLSAAKRLAKAQDAADFLSRGGSAKGAIKRFGADATATGADPGAMARLAAETKRAEEEQRKHEEAVRRSRAALRDHGDGVLEAVMRYDALHTSLRGVAGAMGGIWLTWGKPLLALWAGFAGAQAVKSSVTQFAEFQNTLATIGAIAGESDEAIKRLGDTALALGREKNKGPQEVVDTLRVMTQAGLSAEQSLKSLRTVLDFATVGEMKPDTAAQSLIGIGSAFGFAPESMNRVGDVVAKAAAISQTSIESMTSSVKVSSVVAEQFGARIEDVSGILAVLAKRNIEATMAGTALRNAYSEIYTPSDKAKEVFKKIGLSAYDAQGNMKSFIEVMKELRTIAQGYDKESQNALFSVIFGERGGKVGSALLSDMRGLEEALRQVGDSQGFVAEAAIRMEDSLKNRATVAVNNLKASLIEAGAAAEGPLRTIADEAARLFSDPAFVEGLKSLAVNIANLTRFLVEHADVLGKLVALYAGSKVAGALLNMAGAARTAALGKAALSAEATKAATALGALGTIFPQLADAFARAGASAGGMGGALLRTTMGLVRLVPQLGLAIGAIELATLAWDSFTAASKRAAAQAPVTGKSNADIAAELLKRTEAQIAELETDREVKRLGGSKPSEALNAAQKALVDAQRERADKLREYDEGWRKQNGGVTGGPGYEAGRQSLDVVFAKRVGEAQTLLDRATEANDKLRKLQDAQKLADELRNQLGTGSKKEAFDKLTGGKSYPSSVGTEISAILGKEKAELDAIQKSVDSQQRILDARRRANLIDEEQYSRELEQLTEDRYTTLAKAAQDGLDKLPGLKEKRREDINRKVTDPEERVRQLRAMEAEFEKLTEEWKNRVAEIRAAADEAFTLRGIAEMGRAKKMEDDLQALINDATKRDNQRTSNQDEAIQNALDSVGIDDALRQAKDVLNPISELERTTLEAGLRVNKTFAKLRNDAKAAGDEEYLTKLQAAEARALEIIQETSQLQARAMSDPLVGVRASIVRMLGEVNNLAASTGRAFENSVNAMEDAFTDFVRTGKFQAKDLVTTISAEFARLAFQQAVKKPLLEGLQGVLSAMVGGGAAATGYTGGPSTGVAGNAAAFGLDHAGGLVGNERATRRVDPSIFAGARRYHTGGLVGDEVPIIAKKGERVLNPAQNRQWEMGMGGAGGVAINNYVTVHGGASRADMMNAMEATKRSTIAAIEDKRRRGPTRNA